MYEEETEEQPEQDEEFEDKTIATQMWIRRLVNSEGIFESPIDLNVAKMKEIDLSLLEWVNFEVPPKKMKVTNTGHTIIFSAKWGQERPYITKGPFFGKYVFSNWHLHWGANDMEGSEHTIDGSQYPAEMHVITFKSAYLTQEAALKEQDGCATLVYLFKLQDAPNPAFQDIINVLSSIQKAGTSMRLEPKPINCLLQEFESDYFFYWGTVSTSGCTHYLMWLICRVPIGVSREQIDTLRFIFDENGEQLKKNFRGVQPANNRTVLHICPSTSKYSTLLPALTITKTFKGENFSDH
ncbi:carbonic anhydrase 2-like [Anoplophora glabripennis]|uniref:carbonic anhydrase 2-like n=1 Tax=Anoplophora glabripennis TaxID=217634 RepID=UPI000874B1B2|nr:carbonic anhydrase 2-like [Anoplophora glabripennis]